MAGGGFTDAHRAQARHAVFALGRLKKSEMNRLEAAWELVLRVRKQDGLVLWYKFHGIKLRLADGTFYETDFAVLRADGLMEIHEVKGFSFGDANPKLKISADLYPFRFVRVTQRKKKDGGGWLEEEI